MKKAFILFISGMISFLGLGQNNCNISFDLGNDTTLNCAKEFVIHAPPGVDQYAWSTGSTADSIVVTQSGTYTCYGTQIGSNNLVVNGDFSNGDAGFQSDYIVPSPPYGTYGQLSNEGTYAITSNPNDVHTNFVDGCFDHTSGTQSGKMMVVNGASVPGVYIWKQTITVQPNTQYQLSFWGMSVTTGSPGKLQFSIDGVQVGNVLTLPSSTCQWKNFFVNWTSGSNTTIEIAIINKNTAISGNDFALDDISFSTICSYNDAINVTMPPFPTLSTNTPQTICKGDSVVLKAQSSSNIVSYSWDGGAHTGASYLVSPNQQTVYTVIGTDDNGCQTKPQEVKVNVNPLPEISFQGIDTVCANAEVTVHAQSSIPNSSFNWLNYNSTDDSVHIVVPQSMDVAVEVTSPFLCSQVDSFHITAIPHLEVSIIGDTIICKGDSNILEAKSNLPNTSFTWLPKNVNASVLKVKINDTGYVYLKGNQPVCGSDMDSVLITAGQKPLIIAPANDTICLGDQVNVKASTDLDDAIITWLGYGLTGEHQQFNPQETTTYYLQANVGNCVSPIDSFTVVVRALCDLKIPNVFTPNGDGINDAFHLVKFAGIKSLKCSILNRWGNLVNYFTQPDFQWDGKNKKGKMVDDGIYFYKIEAITSGGNTINKEGYVHVVR